MHALDIHTTALLRKYLPVHLQCEHGNSKKRKKRKLPSFSTASELTDLVKKVKGVLNVTQFLFEGANIF